jgi:hypothetical protein
VPLSASSTTSCVDIISCLLEDHDLLRGQLTVLRLNGATLPEKREALERLTFLLASHTRAEEEVVLARALELEPLQVEAMEALEEHEVTENEIQRVKHSGDNVQFAARMNVLCDLIEHHLKEEEEDLFPELSNRVSAEEREELGMRYREVKERNELAPVMQMPVRESLLASEAGRIGYIIAWLLGVPFWILLLVFLIRGH